MARDARRAGVSVDEVEQRIIAKTALRRLVQPSDIADAVVFLASDLSSCITAETIAVTGGVF
jgi:3-hydroxybutyrate dehydrogenase